MAEHVAFRNGDFFCYHCGQSGGLNLPLSISEMGNQCLLFSEKHTDCKPTWSEPIPPITEYEEINAKWWFDNGEKGLSSTTMYNHFIGKTDFPIYTPSDPDDFKRCYKLLEAVPQWKSRLVELKNLSPLWSALIDSWDKLTCMYEQNIRENWENSDQIGMYQFMKSLGL